MTDAIQELKIRSEILHKRIQAGEASALLRLKSLPGFRRATQPELSAATVAIQRRDCLTIIAVELGFPNWPVAKATLEGSPGATEFGTLLYPKRLGGHTNHWFVNYTEAARIRAARNAYLLAYKRHFFVADYYFVEGLGLDPEDADWKAIAFDWVRPVDPAARTRLYARLIARLPKEGRHE
ncbi:MAG: hypothetical protein HY820_26300 [Acidobacteria bacterium]|nr:hypothetical protein [Acidobacteriota bacterium]